MTNDELRTLIQRFLDLVHNGVGSVEQDERTLVELLDRLALAVHEVPPGAVTSDMDAPDRDYTAVRAVVEARFPNFGLYGAPWQLTVDEELAPLVGDAIDDIADITLDLQETVWTWDHIGVEHALRTFHFGFRSHWGHHLRELLAYVHVEHHRGRDGADPSAAPRLSTVKGAVFRGVEFDTARNEWWFGFRERGGLRASCPWQIYDNGAVVRASGDQGQQYGLPEPIDAAVDATKHLGGKTITDVESDSRTGDLTIRVANGVRLRVVLDSTGYEAWHLVTLDGREVVGRCGEVIAL